MKAIIVGASSGIGKEVAKLYLTAGWEVGLIARREEPLRELQSAYPQQTKILSLDITTDNAPILLKAFMQQMGEVHLYFHAAGTGKQNIGLTAEIEQNTVQTNVIGFTQAVGVAFRYFSAQPNGGHIAVISSIAGTKGLGVAPAYSASKAFQTIYIEALEQQAALCNLAIRFTDIRPGFVDTALLDEHHHHPLLMNAQKVGMAIFQAVQQKKHVCIIDARYRVLVFFWKLIPRWLWRRLPVRASTK